jgi:hypothetical protein
MKRFDPSGGIPEGADAITRLEPLQPPAVARPRVAAFGASYAAWSQAGASNACTADLDPLSDSRSTRNTGRA